MSKNKSYTDLHFVFMMLIAVIVWAFAFPFIRIGLDELSFTIYPNPATDYIRINSNIGVENLIIRDIAGRVVIEKNNLSSSERIELGGFKSGIYLVTMKKGNSVTTQKLIVR